MLTDPTNFPEKSGIDERDQQHPDFPKKITEVLITHPFKKIAEKMLFFESALLIMIFFTGVAELIGRRLSICWYIALLIVMAITAYKTHRRLTHLESQTK